ncbi:MAG: fatty acid desaturase [Candidatus Binatia bacterium]
MASGPAVERIKVDREWIGAPEGTVTNPTVWLLVAAYATLGIGTHAYVAGTLPVWLVVALHAAALYVVFTPLHESMHGVAHQSALLNAWIGRLAGVPLTITLPIFRGTHYEHHSHTNDPGRDPDLVVARRPRLLLPLWCLAIVVEYRRHFYGRRLHRSRRDWWEAIAFDVLLLAFVTTAIAGGWWRTALVLWLGPAAIAVVFLGFAFDFVPHYPYDSNARYLDTRIYGGSLLNAVLLGQNRHLIHHLWTTIPWFRYQGIFRRIRGDLEARGCRIGWRISPLRAAIPEVQSADATAP